MNGFQAKVPALQFLAPTPLWKEFWLLTLISEDSRISQHRIAQTLGISSAMTNTYIKQFIQKGYIGITGETNRSIRYNLTQAGKRTKRDLLHLYGREVARVHTAAREEYRKRVSELADKGIKSVVLFGAATTGELVYQAAMDTSVDVIAVVDNDPGKQGKSFGHLIVEKASALDRLTPDAIIIAAFGRPKEIYEQIKHLKQRGLAIIRF